MPAFEIDLGTNYALLQLFAIMWWPDDAMARQDYCVTIAAQAMQLAGDLHPCVADEVREVLVRRLQADPAVIDEKARKLGAAIAFIVREEISNDLFHPSGGFSRVAAAGGVEAIRKSAMEQGGRFGRACGEILAYIVRLRKHHHPDIEPSLNRATHILVRAASKEGRKIPGARDLATMWTGWGGVAPLWGAYVLCTQAALAGGDGEVAPEAIISGSRWLADFAVAFKPKGSKAPLLPEAKVVRIQCQLPAVEPEISPLTNEELVWARAYRVRP